MTSFRRRFMAAVFGALLAAAAGAANAQADARGAKDHPLLTRYPNSYITEYAKNYNAVEFAVGQGEGG